MRRVRPESGDPVPRKLLVLGAASTLLYLAVTYLSHSFRYGEGHAARPLLQVLGLFVLAWIGYALALRMMFSASLSVRGSNATENAEPRRWILVLGYSVVFRLILVASAPIQEIDYYRYLWDGRSLLHGINPYRYAPAEIECVNLRSTPDPMLEKASRLSRESISLNTIFQRVHHREVPTIYPPLSQAVFALAAWLVPPEAPVWAHVLVLKAILIAFDLGVVVALAALLARVGLPASWSLAYGWCPLALKEVANAGHLDAIAVCLSVLSAFFLVGVGPRGEESRRLRSAVLGVALLGLSTLAKSYPLVLAPLVCSFLAARLRWRATLGAAAFALVLVIGYAPFLMNPNRFAHVETGHSPWSGLATFLARWQKNDFLFMLAHENLRPPSDDQPDRWFVTLPGELRQAVHDQVARPLVKVLGVPNADPAFVLTQLVMGSILLIIVLGWCVAVVRRPDETTLLRGMALVLVWGWLLSATPHPWYLMWSLPFLLFTGRRSWFLLTVTAFVYYLRFWMEYQALEFGPGAVESALARFDYEVVWVEYLPVLMWVMYEKMQTQSRRSGDQLPSEGRNTGAESSAGTGIS